VVPGLVRVVPPQHLLLSQDEHHRRVDEPLLGQHGAADCHDKGDDAIDALGAPVLGALEVAGGVLGDGDVDDRPEA
jgi:hypothetical protein